MGTERTNDRNITKEIKKAPGPTAGDWVVHKCPDIRKKPRELKRQGQKLKSLRWPVEKEGPGLKKGCKGSKRKI